MFLCIVIATCASYKYGQGHKSSHAPWLGLEISLTMAQGERVLPLWICLSGVCRQCCPMWLGRSPVPSAPSTTPGASAPHLPRNWPVKWHPHKCQAQPRTCDLGQQLVQTGLCMTPPMKPTVGTPCSLPAIVTSQFRPPARGQSSFLWGSVRDFQVRFYPAMLLCLLLPSSLTPYLLSASPLC